MSDDCDYEAVPESDIVLGDSKTSEIQCLNKHPSISYGELRVVLNTQRGYQDVVPDLHTR